jgi:hypothetical protein
MLFGWSSRYTVNVFCSVRSNPDTVFVNPKQNCRSTDWTFKAVSHVTSFTEFCIMTTQWQSVRTDGLLLLLHGYLARIRTTDCPIICPHACNVTDSGTQHQMSRSRGHSPYMTARNSVFLRVVAFCAMFFPSSGNWRVVYSLLCHVM